MTIENRLQVLRETMREHEVDYYLVPSIDAHNSEYVPTCWERRTWISNFTGSAGEALVGMDHAYLSTDGRYFLQASQELDSNYYSLIKQIGFVSEIELFLQKNASNKSIGIDPKVIGIGRFARLQQLMNDIGGKLVSIENNLVDISKNKLGEEVILPNKKIMLWDDKFSGFSTKDKLSWLRGELLDNKADYILLNVLDEIAWLFNIRGYDVDFNPYAISYAIIGKDNATLLVDNEKLNDEILAKFKKLNINTANYDQFATEVAKISGVIMLDEATASQWMLDCVLKIGKAKFIKSPIVLAKACKNEVEKEGMRLAHRKDAVAVIKYLTWINSNWQNGLDEISSSDKLEDFRKKQDNFYGLSFSTISGYADNGAIIHYRASEKSKKMISNDAMYLLDSGGQYLEGTTDITRTLHLGTPTNEEKKHYTLVLKGHLALGRAKFPEGTKGEHLDILARMPLYNELLNYRHGTGHGVGCFLGVHEGPQKISTAASAVPLMSGMIVSNEPGLYFEGQYGIRIENLVLVNEINQKSEYGQFFEFEDLTLVPYCKKLIDFSMIDNIELNQIKTYYKKIETLVLPLLDSDSTNWLKQELAI